MNGLKEEKMNGLIRLCCLWGIAIIVSLFVFGLSSSTHAQELKIGFVMGLTGGTATWGNQAQNMAKLIEEEVNAAGGFKVKWGKVKVVFKYYDSESNAEVGSSVTARAISDGCSIIMAGPQSAVGFTASERTERAGILFVDPYNTTDKLSERGFKYYFRVNAPNNIAVQESIKYLLWQEKKTGTKLKNVVIFTVDNVTGRSKGNQYQEWIPKLAPHWNVAEYVKFPPKTNDFTIWLNSFKAKKVDALLGDQYPTDAILITRQSREINYNPIAIHGVHGGHYDPEYGKNLQWLAIGTTDTCYFSPFTKIPGVNALNDKYKKIYGSDIPQNAANVACAITLVKDVVDRAGSVDIEAMRKAFVNTNLTRKEYKEGEWWYIKTYDVKFDANGQNIKASNITNVWTTPTRMEPVYPEEFATTVAPWPKLNWKELEEKYSSQFPLGK